MRLALIGLLLLLSTTSWSEPNALYAFGRMETSMGTIQFKLFKKDAPKHVANFIGLATGKKPFRDVKTGEEIKGRNFYKNMIFHKVHPQLVIQTGCPWGTGKGWPGFTVSDEKNDLKFDQPFYIAMAKIQDKKNSVGSQFFITTRRLDHLNGKYTVIGQVTSGQEVVKAISRVPRDAMMKPLSPVKLKEVVIESE